MCILGIYVFRSYSHSISHNNVTYSRYIIFGYVFCVFSQMRIFPSTDCDASTHQLQPDVNHLIARRIPSHLNFMDNFTQTGRYELRKYFFVQHALFFVFFSPSREHATKYYKIITKNESLKERRENAYSTHAQLLFISETEPKMMHVQNNQNSIPTRFI